MEQIRIIKEMRDESRRRLSVSGSNVDIRHIKPRFMVWENVTGALSSNKGEDFRCVLEETAKVVSEDAIIPRLAEGQKWSYAGCIMGDGWSIAWRIHDAQFWGVPQRRKRIALVADFGGQSAPEILFERKGVSGDIKASEREGEDHTTNIEGCTDKTSGRSIDQPVFCLEGNGSRDSHRGDGYKASEISYTLNTVEQHAVCYGISSYDSNAMKSSNPNSGFYEADTSRALDNNGGNPACNQGGMMIVDNGISIIENHPNDSRIKIKDDNVFQTLSSRMGTGGNNVPMVMKTYQEKTGTLDCCINKGTSTQLLNNMFIANSSIVRRLTPMECERLQGFPDNWTNIGDWVDSKGKKHHDADSPRYKALGNSIALPFWDWMAGRMVEQLRKDGNDDLTMASLFDGIGGFPLVYSNHGCKPVWASEIEEFPIAVTKLRFPE